MQILFSEVLDIIRLLAVPVFVWAAYHDYHTRRVSNTPWKFLAVGGAVLLLVDSLLVLSGMPTHRYAPAFWQTAALSIFVVLPGAYLAWWIGLFGGADAKALMALSIWFPVIPQYTPSLIWTDTTTILPLYSFPVTVFTITIFVNSVLLSVLYPLGTLLRNLITGNIALPMLFARPIALSKLADTHGALFEGPEGYGVHADLDVLRSYLTWRDLEFTTLEPFLDHSTVETTDTDLTPVEHWGTDLFFHTTSELTYQETPESLAESLEHLSTNTSVWVSPGIPYMIPFLGGLLTALTYGNLLIWVIQLFQ